MSAPNTIAGKNGSVTVNSVSLSGTAFDATFEIDDDDTTNFNSAGWGEVTGGILRGSGTIDLVAKTTEQIYASSIGLLPGSYLSATLNDYASHGYAGTMFVKSVNEKVAVSGAVRYTVNWKTHGPWTLPTA